MHKILSAFLVFLGLVFGCQTPDTVDSSAEDVRIAKGTLVIGFTSGDSLVSVTAHLTLPTSAANGVSIRWTSDNEAVTSSGVVTRPSSGADVVVSLTAALSKGSASDTVVFVVSVKALSGALTVRYDGNGGAGTVTDAKLYTPGQRATALANGFTRPGYLFSGWNTLANGAGTSWAPGAQFSVIASMVLYAQWRLGEASGTTSVVTPVNSLVTVTGPSALHYGTVAGFSVDFAGTASRYQWYLDGVALIGEAGQTLTFTPTVSALSWGGHLITSIVTNPAGSQYSGSLAISVSN